MAYVWPVLLGVLFVFAVILALVAMLGIITLVEKIRWPRILEAVGNLVFVTFIVTVILGCVLLMGAVLADSFGLVDYSWLKESK